MISLTTITRIMPLPARWVPLGTDYRLAPGGVRLVRMARSICAECDKELIPEDSACPDCGSCNRLVEDGDEAVAIDDSVNLKGPTRGAR
jgi:RNA polymerase subunit RPABC4/transcription elongation factor Spt4